MKDIEIDGIIFRGPDRSCLFCKNCQDFFWDYTHGPYMFICDMDADTNKGYNGNCIFYRGIEDERYN